MRFKTSYYVYILECVDGSYYTGITVDVEKRLKEHNGYLAGGAVYTRSKRPVKLRHFEIYPTHKEAAQREYQIKQLTREQKTFLIAKARIDN